MLTGRVYPHRNDTNVKKVCAKVNFSPRYDKVTHVLTTIRRGIAEVLPWDLNSPPGSSLPQRPMGQMSSEFQKNMRAGFSAHYVPSPFFVVPKRVCIWDDRALRCVFQFVNGCPLFVAFATAVLIAQGGILRIGKPPLRHLSTIRFCGPHQSH